ncbi:hypothetical protein, partial [Streptomyces sp. SID8380]
PEPLPHPSAATPGPARSVLEARATLAAVQAAWLSLLRDGERCRVDPPAAPVTHSTRENEEESRC